MEPIEPPSAAPSRPVNFGSGDLVLVAGRLYFCSGDACQWPYSLWCFLPEVELGPRGFDLVFGDLPFRVFPSWY